MLKFRVWTELIGLRGPIAGDRLACGFLFLGSWIEYPRHRHKAEEIYVPLTGQIFFQQGNQDWTDSKPCRPIYNAPWEVQAMRTEAEPTLMLYLWRGENLIEKSHIEN
jgi:hypothetical protein